MLKIAHFLLLFLICNCTLAQQNSLPEPCGYDRIMEILEEQYPGFRKQYDKAYLESLKPQLHVSSRKYTKSDTSYYFDTVYTIPVVFHVLYNTSQENVHDSLIYNQLEVLNQDFRRLNPDTGSTRNIFKDRAGDVRIQFVLADKDPSNNATTGIVRKTTSRTTFYTQTLAEMKRSADGGDDAWNPKKYLNIWVCDLTYQGQDALFGFAYPPYGHPYWTAQSWVADIYQGVVLHYKIVGRNNPLSVGATLGTSNKGRVATHEVGHYFGLRHIWGDAVFGSGCDVDDYIDDTPNQAIRSNFNCSHFSNTCNDPGTKQYPDMVENYMDYSAHACQNMFTQQQILAMRNSLVQYRNELPITMSVTQKMRVKDTTIYDQIKIFVTSNDRVMVETTNENIKEDMRMDVMDLTGQYVMQNLRINRNENIVNTVNLAPGIYFFHLKKADNHSVKIEKLLITKH